MNKDKMLERASDIKVDIPEVFAKNTAGYPQKVFELRQTHTSTPTWHFIPKYHWVPFLVDFISGSRCFDSFFVEVGAWIMVASTIVPFLVIIPFSENIRVIKYL